VKIGLRITYFGILAFYAAFVKAVYNNLLDIYYGLFKFYLTIFFA